MSAWYAELVGFVIFIGIILWKIVPVVQRMLDRRRDTIRSAIDSAAGTLAAAEEELKRRTTMLEEARSESEAILAQADATAAQLRDDGRRRADQEYERILAAARAEVEQERQRARDEVAAEVGEIVVRAAEQVVRAELDEARQRALVDQVIAAAQANGAVR
jgi:F-type H+-transporting ATPase subunit b